MMKVHEEVEQECPQENRDSYQNPLQWYQLEIHVGFLYEVLWLLLTNGT